MSRLLFYDKIYIIRYIYGKIYLEKYNIIDFEHNISYINYSEVIQMNDFQIFLDNSLTKIDVESISKVDAETYKYDIYKEIRDMVIEARNESGLTQKELASKSGLTQANISNIEKGTTRPTIDSLKKIADATGKRLVVQLANREVML